MTLKWGAENWVRLGLEWGEMDWSQDGGENRVSMGVRRDDC